LPSCWAVFLATDLADGAPLRAPWVINLYGKIEVNTRAGAALFALEHNLIQL
jgi:hypothetical protein